jgi:NADH dehydrogenase
MRPQSSARPASRSHATVRLFSVGQLCSLGGRSAVAEFLGMQLSGFIAWIFWRGVYLSKLPSWARRLQVGVDWAWLLCFPRDLAHLRTQQTDRVHRVHYRPGDIILRPGDVPQNLLVIQSGEVELVGAGEAQTASVAPSVGVLGASSFLGEQAFLGNESFGFVARARTPVELVAMGRNILTQLSTSLAPLRNALAATLRRRTTDVWKARPEVFAILRRASLRGLMDPAPDLLVSTRATLDDVGRAFAERDDACLYVCRADRALEGIVTMTDWTRAAATTLNPATPVTEFMTRQPLSITIDEDLLSAAGLFREHGLKHLPVVDSRDRRRLVGVLRVRRLLAHVYASRGEMERILPAAA